MSLHTTLGSCFVMGTKNSGHFDHASSPGSRIYSVDTLASTATTAARLYDPAQGSHLDQVEDLN